MEKQFSMIHPDISYNLDSVIATENGRPVTVQKMLKAVSDIMEDILDRENITECRYYYTLRYLNSLSLVLINDKADFPPPEKFIYVINVLNDRYKDKKIKGCSAEIVLSVMQDMIAFKKII